MSIHLPNSLTRSAIIHGAVLGLTAGLIGSALAVQNPPNNRPVPPPTNEKPRLPATVPPANATATDRLYAGWSTHPLGASDCTATVPDNTMQLFKNTEFKGNMASVDNVTGQTPGGSHGMPSGLNDDM